jgi:hypothetical protein
MSFALAIASASSANGIRQATGPKISSCAMRMRLSTSANTVGLTKLPFLQAPVQRRRSDAAAHHGRALLGSELDVAAHLRQVIGADHGTDDGLLIQRIADGDAPRPLGKFCDEVRVDGLLHQNPRARRAALAVVGEDHEYRGIERARQIGVVEDDERALAAQLHREFLQAGGLTMRLPVAVEPVKEIARTSGCRHKGSPASAP